jgi:hypothetical protein
MIYINQHEIHLDEDEGLLPWKDYDHVVWLSMEFIRNCPIEPRSGLPWYLVYSCFWTDPLRPVLWPDNPAGKFAMAVNTLIHYYAYSGQPWFKETVRTMLDRLIAYHTPDHFKWPGIPYASAEPVFGVYFGARADDPFVTEPDKIAQAALGYLNFYKLTDETAYLDHARHCADVLGAEIKPGDETHSPWPFRVDAREGTVVEAYTSHVIAAIQLFEDLIELNLDPTSAYQTARDVAWNWLVQYPLQNQLWKGYFEDIRLDPENGNRDQYSPLETARYILMHPGCIPDWKHKVQELLEWVKDTLGSEPFFKAIPIHEQRYCYHVMGSHTARYASVCAQFAEISGELHYAEEAYRCFNWATYMADEHGWVRVGVDRPDYHNQCWFTDGYFDYVPHFLIGMASLPDLSPAASDHILRSSSVVQEVSYSPYEIRYKTFDAEATDLLRITFEPLQVFEGDKTLAPVDDLTQAPGWCYEHQHGLLQVHHGSSQVVIRGNE